MVLALGNTKLGADSITLEGEAELLADWGVALGFGTPIHSGAAHKL